jgi:hypothetical protein
MKELMSEGVASQQHVRLAPYTLRQISDAAAWTTEKAVRTCRIAGKGQLGSNSRTMPHRNDAVTLTISGALPGGECQALIRPAASQAGVRADLAGARNFAICSEIDRSSCGSRQSESSSPQW